MIEPYGPSLYHVPDKVVPNINMLGSVVEHKILRKTNSTLVVTKDHGGIQHMLKQLTKELPQLNNFTTGHIDCNLFSLGGA